MRQVDVTIIDYGMGNIWSVVSALRFLEANVKVSSDPKEVEKSKSLILPGVGSFRKAMQALKSLDMDQAILNNVQMDGHKILGICLGMQLMGNKSSEDGSTLGLNLIPSSVEEFTPEEVKFNKIPHVGFNQVIPPAGSLLFQSIKTNADFYFVHSFRMSNLNLPGLSSISNYGIDFLSAFENKNIFATQFHPEKSQTNGLKLLRNFLTA